MQESNKVFQAQEVATTFEKIFVENWDIKPSTLNLSKCTPRYAGMDSFDTIVAIMEMEHRFTIRVYGKEGDALMHAPIGNMLKMCTKKLVEQNRLSANDAKMVTTNYVNLIKQVNQNQK